MTQALPDEAEVANAATRESAHADQRAMARLVAGEPEALDELMRRHAPRLFGYLRRALQNEGDAADTAQEVFCRVYQHRARFEPGRQFDTWLYAIAANLVRDRYRWRLRHPTVPLDAPERTEESRPAAERIRDPTPGAPEQLVARERAVAVRTAVGELPEFLRQPLLLAEYEGKSQVEIGAILGCSRKAVEKRVARARELLRDRLRRWLA